MPNPTQALVAHAFSLLWERIYNPRSACPDVELGFIHQEMTRILQSLGPKEGTAAEQWVIAQLLLGPRSLETLQWGWLECQDPQPTAPQEPEQLELFLADRDYRVRLAYEAIARSVDQLLSDGRILPAEGLKQLRLP